MRLNIVLTVALNAPERSSVIQQIAADVAEHIQANK